MATTTEVERKYEVPTGFAVPDLSGVPGVVEVGEPAEHSLDATYYDTPSLHLAAHRVTLRRRTGGHDAGWHLKRPAGDDRSETHEPLGGPHDGVPAAVAEQVRELSQGEPLAPVAHIRTRRLERPLCDADGHVLALVADDAVASEALGDPAVVQQWRELEVELVDGPRTVLDAVDAALRAAGARPAQSPSKLARALADRYPATAPAPTAPTAASADETATTPAGRALTGYLRAQRDAIAANDAGVRAGDPEAVHDMRVATRRLRSTLRTFRKMLDRDQTQPLRDELQWLGGELGDVRDGDVMAERLAAAVAAEPPELVVGPVAARIRQRLAARTAQARERLVAALDSPRYTALLSALDEVVRASATVGPSRGRLRRRVRRAVRRADERLDSATTDVQLHEARKAYKRARYAVEVFHDLAGKPARQLAKRFTALQDVLGAHQDSVVTGDLLRQYGMQAHLDGENAFTYGLLHGRQHEAGETSLRGLAKARRRSRRGRVRRWLG